MPFSRNVCDTCFPVFVRIFIFLVSQAVRHSSGATWTSSSMVHSSGMIALWLCMPQWCQICVLMTRHLVTGNRTWGARWRSEYFLAAGLGSVVSSSQLGTALVVRDVTSRGVEQS